MGEGLLVVVLSYQSFRPSAQNIPQQINFHTLSEHWAGDEKIPMRLIKSQIPLH